MTLRNPPRARLARLRLPALCCASFVVIAACGAGNGGTSTNPAAHGGAGNGNDSAGSAGTAQAGAANAGTTFTSGGTSNATGGNSNATGGTHATGGTAGASTAGGAGSAGTAGAAGNGSTTHGAGCTQSGLLFCDDFEKLAAGPVQNAGPWSTSFIGPDAPTITVDATTPAHSGTHSIMVHAPDTDFQSFLVYHDAAVLPHAPSFYLRAYVRLGRAMADHHNAYLRMDTPTQQDGGPAVVRFGEDAQMLSLTVGGDAHGSLSSSTFSQDGILGPHLVASTWGCLEGYFDSAQPEVDFWLDGAEIPAFHHTDWPTQSYDTLHFGYEKYAGPDLDIWFDDIAISATRIGCN